MNNYQLFDNSLILQQQLLLQQMFIYNQMLVQKTKMLSKPTQQPIIQKTADENESSSPSISKLEETHQVKPLSLKSNKKIEKLTIEKKPKRLDEKNAENKESSQKKKIFLSMLDIKEAQYKKFKVIEIDQEKKAVISSQAEQ